MEHEFWHSRWERNKIAFHEGTENALIAAHFPKLQLVTNSRIFVPLCGKTRDIAWLLSQGHRVVGAELSALAITQLFEELNVTPQIVDRADHKLYRAPQLDIFVGDIFTLSQEILGEIDAVIDRAAFVALPDQMRGHYASHLAELSSTSPQLLVTFEYDQSATNGPPFSISTDEVFARYEKTYMIERLQTAPVSGGLRKATPATETIWHLAPR
ncbi:thiopurine S-methyltransferase [Yoonia maritima]|uniref:thiopurine S-methyltransferase n=1 Tax=Yoonia maritima TaxID=1435347 RepID=UPI000D0EEDAB|nr:thiopurine S-methyltransferase [Yoonia maritima]